jgi:hypothetical protein
MDYDILPNTDLDINTSSNLPLLRHQQYVKRIRLGRVLQSLLLNALGTENKGINIESSIIELGEILKLDDIDSSSTAHFQWAQHITCNDSSFEKYLWTAVVSFWKLTACALKFSTTVMESVRENDVIIPVDTGDEDLDAFIDAMQAVTNCLGLSINNNHLSAASSASKHTHYTPIRPSWIKAVSLFRLTLGTWGPLVGCKLFGLKLDESTGKKKKGKKSNMKKGGGKEEEEETQGEAVFPIVKCGRNVKIDVRSIKSAMGILN